MQSLHGRVKKTPAPPLLQSTGQLLHSWWAPFSSSQHLITSHRSRPSWSQLFFLQARFAAGKGAHTKLKMIMSKMSYKIKEVKSARVGWSLSRPDRKDKPRQCGPASSLSSLRELGTAFPIYEHDRFAITCDVGWRFFISILAPSLQILAGACVRWCARDQHTRERRFSIDVIIITMTFLVLPFVQISLVKRLIFFFSFPDGEQEGTRTAYKCTWKGCDFITLTCSVVERHVRDAHLGWVWFDCPGHFYLLLD